MQYDEPRIELSLYLSTDLDEPQDLPSFPTRRSSDLMNDNERIPIGIEASSPTRRSRECNVIFDDAPHRNLIGRAINKRHPATTDVGQNDHVFAGMDRRSEERRVGQECRSRWSPDLSKQQ